MESRVLRREVKCARRRILLLLRRTLMISTRTEHTTVSFLRMHLKITIRAFVHQLTNFRRQSFFLFKIAVGTGDIRQERIFCRITRDLVLLCNYYYIFLFMAA
jgi:hypothetical protein